MTNIVYWNIRQFSINLIDSPDANFVPNIAGLTYAAASQQRLAVILAVINAAQADIISIVEVQTGSDNWGDLCSDSGGMQAARTLLNRLRLADAAAQWRLVPPLWLGARGGNAPAGVHAETVAVLYRGVTGNVARYFTGPNVWTGGFGGVSVNPLPGPVAPQNYPPPFNTLIDAPAAAMPARVIPAAGPLYRAGQFENQSAARIEFSRAAARAGGRRARIDIYGGFRPPFMTSFYEVSIIAPLVVQRNLTLFSTHSPPNKTGAKALMRAYAGTPEISDAPGANETKILCGDFNIDFLTAGGAYSGAYAPVIGLGYQSLLPPHPVPPVNPNHRRAYLGYFATHMRDQPRRANAAASRFLWSNGAGALSYYPGYGYSSTGQTASIDNILVNPGAAQPLTIMNLVTGSPFAAPVGWPMPPAPNYPPLGATVLAWQFANLPALPVWPPPTR